MNFKKLFSELKRRNVYKVAFAYGITSWLLLQVADVIAPIIDAPEWLMRAILILLIIGFPIALIMSWVYEISPEGSLKTTKEIKEGDSVSIKKKPVVLTILFGVLLISLAGQFVYHNYWGVSSMDKSNIEKSIAVLPFKNDSPNEENLYFCNGIMDGILNNLAKIPELSVVSRTSVEKYRENSSSVAEIAKELNVNYILEGSVLRIGDRIRITAQLIYSREDNYLSSYQFDENIENAETIFSIIADVSQNIAKELKAKISPELKRRIEFVPTSNLTAFDYFLQGKELFYNWFRTHDKSNLTNAHILFDNAIKQDSTFGLAYAGKAAVFSETPNVKNYLDSIRIYSNKAILLDPDAAFAYAVRGGEYYMKINDMKKAGIDLKKAYELSPNDDFIVRDLAIYYAKNEEYINALKIFKKAEKVGQDSLGLAATYYYISVALYRTIGDMDKSLFFINKSIELNPLWKSNFWWHYIIAGNFQEALEFANNNNWNLGSTYSYIRGRSDSTVLYLDQLEVEKKIERGEKYNLKEAHFRYGAALIDVGRTEEGMSIVNYNLQRIKKLISAGSANRTILYHNILIYSFLGETDKAIESLKRLDENYDWGNLFYLMQIDPLFDNIRDNPEYQKIVNKRLAEHARIREEITQLEAK